MKRILLLSDNHSYWDETIEKYVNQSDEVWHAGDFGSLLVLEEIEKRKPLKGVYGNIDDHVLRKVVPEVLVFKSEEVKVLMIHIGGYPGKYSGLAKKEIEIHKPSLFISGHSHILKAMYDSKNNLLHLNPGACGKQGWHKKRTMMKFQVDGLEIKNLEIVELGGR